MHTGRAVSGVGDDCACAVAVFQQQRHARERTSTDVAVVLFDVVVRLQVRSQIGPVSERSLAVWTGERLLARVRSHVTLQQPRSRERLAAQSTSARQSVRANVHLESARRRVRFVALRTSLVLARRRHGRSAGEVSWMLRWS